MAAKVKLAIAGGILVQACRLALRSQFPPRINPFIEVRYEGSEDIDFFGANIGLSIGLN